MATIGLIAALIVGATFVVAGASKLAIGPAWTGQAEALGAPRIVTPVVPFFELAIGALSIVGVGWPVVPWLMVASLVAFVALILHNLAAGRRPVCACFGDWSSRSISWRDVVRNAVLIVVALAALYR